MKPKSITIFTQQDYSCCDGTPIVELTYRVLVKNFAKEYNLTNQKPCTLA
jgi:hypothetical protein